MFSFRGRIHRLATAIAVIAIATATPLAVTAGPAAAADVTGLGKTKCTSNGAGAITCSATFSGAKAYNPTATNPNTTYTTTPTVTARPTDNLNYQGVHVTWSNFTPSSGSMYNVGLFECRGAVDANGVVTPTAAPQLTWNDQTGATGFSSPTSNEYKQGGSCYAIQSDLNSYSGPSNALIYPTSTDQTGSGDIAVETAFENQWLGCSDTVMCWLAVVPNWGGDGSTGTCTSHGNDANWAVDVNIGAPCSWADRIMVPLNFSPTAAACTSRANAFNSEGSPILARGLAQWRNGWCTGSGGLTFGYNSGVDEYVSRQAFLQGSGSLTASIDSAFVTQPASADATTSAKRPFTYAPIANTSIAIAYYVDNATAKLPITTLRLNARLMAKLLTQSYSLQYNSCSGSTTPTKTCDPDVSGNPVSIFVDPEFLALNPEVASVSFTRNQLVKQGGFLPTVVAGNSDLVHELTRWIASDPDAAAFLDGKDDGYGMHVNRNYRGIKYPLDKFEALDEGFVATGDQWTMQSTWFPKTGLAAVANTLVQNKTTAVNVTGVPASDPTAPLIHATLDPTAPGARALFAVVSGADAAAFNFPVAQLQNNAGQFVAPTTSSLTAAVKDYTTNADKITQQNNFDTTDPKAYPLTMTSYAMVATCGYSSGVAAGLSRMLTSVVGDAQVYGTAPGQLAPGYLNLTSAQSAQTLTTANMVAGATGACPTTSTGDGGSSGTSGGSSSSTTGGGSTGTDGTGSSGTGTGTGSDGTSGTGGTSNPDAVPSDGVPPQAQNNGKNTGTNNPQAVRNVDYGVPSTTGSGWTHWIAPVAAILAGVLLLGGGGFYLASGSSVGAAVGDWFRSLSRRP